MSAKSVDPRHEKYMQAIRSRVCGVCLDSRDNRSCGLTGRLCAIEGHLPRLVAALSSVESTHLEGYEAAIRAQVCSSCDNQDTQGRCALREDASCALDAYISLVLDAVEEVNAIGAGCANGRSCGSARGVSGDWYPYCDWVDDRGLA